MAVPGEFEVPSLLHMRAVAPRTRKLYDVALSRFAVWLRLFERVVLRCSARSVMSMDRLLCCYVTFLFNRGYPHHWAAYCFNGLMHIDPGWHGALQMSARALKAWKREQPSRTRAVMPREVACLVASVMYTHLGDEAGGLMTLLAFECYLRCGELVAVRACDLVELRGRLFVKLPSTKTGPDQGVPVTDPTVALLVRRLARRRDPDQHLFPSGSARQYRALFQAALRLLGLHKIGFTPHSMRHGGATHDFHHRGVTVEDVLLRGRWKSTKSARHYIRSLPALLAKVAVPDWVMRHGRAMEGMLDYVFTLPVAR